MKRKMGVILGLTGLLTAAGCGYTPGSGGGEDETTATGMALTIDYLGETDVVGMRFLVKTCAGDPVLSVDKDLEDLTLPGGIPAFENKPFDSDSEHLFADHFMVLDAGCYDVRVTPLTAEKTASQDCAVAQARNIEVIDGKTTEVLLVSQCKGDERGGLDVIGALNHPPVIRNLTYDPSKFLMCPEDVVICVTAEDPDDDPIEFEWEQISGPVLGSFPNVISHDQSGGTATECIQVSPTHSGTYGFKVTAFDMFHSKKKGHLIRAEEWFEHKGYGDVKSRDYLKFPLYVSCPKKPKPDAGVEDDVTDVGGEIDVPDVGDEDVTDVGGEIDVPDVEDDVEDGVNCTYTIGYWMTHSKYGPAQVLLWPDIDGNPATDTEDTMLCGLTWYEILWAAPGNPPEDGPDDEHWYVLAQQYIGARLNVAQGADDTEIENALLDAQEILADCEADADDVGTRTGLTTTELADLLDDFNNGIIGPGHCDDVLGDND